MKKIQQNDIQRQIACLIVIVENCMRSSEDLNHIQNKIELLPRVLNKLKEQEQILNRYKADNINAIANYEFVSEKQNISPTAESLELELDILVNDLEKIMQEFTVLKYKIDNIVVLKEQIEAIQEERFSNITLERIYTVLERQKKNRTDLNINTEENNRWQKVKKQISEFKTLPKIAGATAIVISVISCFSFISYSSIKYQEIKPDNSEKVQSIDRVSSNT